MPSNTSCLRQTVAFALDDANNGKRSQETNKRICRERPLFKAPWIVSADIGDFNLLFIKHLIKIPKENSSLRTSQLNCRKPPLLVRLAEILCCFEAYFWLNVCSAFDW